VIDQRRGRRGAPTTVRIETEQSERTTIVVATAYQAEVDGAEHAPATQQPDR